MKLRSRWVAVPMLVVAIALGGCAKSTQTASGKGSPAAPQVATGLPSAAPDLSSARTQLSTVDAEMQDLNGDISSADAGINSTAEGDVAR